MMKIILWGLLVYFLYNFIFRFVIPATKVASQMKNQVRKMQEQQEATLREMKKNQAEQQRFEKEQVTKHVSERKNDDYIDFEEVK